MFYGGGVYLHKGLSIEGDYILGLLKRMVLK